MSTQAARLDHRDLNRDLRVFATDPLAGAGLPLWLPDGVRDSRGQEETIATVQVDFSQPEQFGSSTTRPTGHGSRS